MKIIISGEKVYKVIVIIIVVLILLSIFGQISRYFLGHGRLLGFVDQFNLDFEKNIPTFFQTALIFFSALLIFFILKSNIIKEIMPKHFWIILFIMVLYMGTDEIVSIHERMDIIVSKFYSSQLHGFYYFSWVIVGSIIALVFIIYFSFFIIKMDKRIRPLFIMAAFLYLFGAIIMEMISGFYFDISGRDFIYQLLVNLEEGAEMFGIAVFIKALIKYINLKMSKILIFI